MANALMDAVGEFEIAEANLVRLERLWRQIFDLLPTGLSFGDDPEFEDLERSFQFVLTSLPAIDGWKPEIFIPAQSDVAQWRLDAQEADEISAHIAVDNEVDAPGRLVREYRARFGQKRRELIRQALIEIMADVDVTLVALRPQLEGSEPTAKAPKEPWEALSTKIKQIEVLLGSTVQHPASWSVLRRHLHFGCVCDFHDIDSADWPAAKEALTKGLYGENEPLPQKTVDLGALVSARPQGSVATRLNWSALSPESFEHLIFTLLSNEDTYENPEWSMKTNAPDRGRDLAAYRIVRDSLADVQRQRVIFQCKHWQSKSVRPTDLMEAVAQAMLWDAPAADILIVVTSGRFTADAIQWIEKYNASRSSPRIEHWPDSRLELILAERPYLIAEFGLR